MFARSCIIIICICFSTLQILAEEWVSGSIQLKNKKSFRGEILFQPGRDAIMLRIDGATMIFPAFRVETFNFVDTESHFLRKFISLPISIGAYTAYDFFEVMVEGEISLLKQQQIMWYSVRQETITFNYFVLNEGRVITIKEFRRQVLPELKNTNPSVSDFAKRNKIKIYDINDNAKLLRYYNSSRLETASTRNSNS
jgi:hypothetical protein